MKVKLYIGAHKTATTHIQRILTLNNDSLIENNIKLSVPNDLRKKWLPDFLRYVETNDSRLISGLVNVNSSAKVWIIAEENISGVSKEFLTSNEIYPNLRKRLICLKKIFCHQEIELFFSIRSYETYYRSAYLEVVRNNGFFPFSDFYDDIRFQHNSWLNVIDCFSELIPEQKINIWRYESFEDVMPDVINGLTDSSVIDSLIKNYPDGKTRTSISAKTLMKLEERDKSLTREGSKNLLESLNKKYPSGQEFPVFMPFSSHQIAQFQRQYKNEVEALSTRYPTINFFS